MSSPTRYKITVLLKRLKTIKHKKKPMRWEVAVKPCIIVLLSKGIFKRLNRHTVRLLPK